MRRRWNILLAFVVATVVAVPARATGPIEPFHVSATAGDDANPGTEQKPFRTIAKAQAVVRDTIAKGMSTDVTVLIRGGNYYLEQPLVFDLRDSGRDGHKVVYRAAPGEHPRIVGGTPLSGWQPAEGQAYKVNVGKGREFSALFENGQWCTLARSPNAGYWQAVGGTNDGKNSTIEFRPGDLPEGLDFRGASAAVWAGRHYSGLNYDWFESLVPIQGIDWKTHTITLTRPTYWNVSTNNRYHILGPRAFLDEPGEFSLDREEGVLYYRPRSLPVEKQEIIAPTCQHAILIRGDSSDQLAGNLVFEGLLLDVCDSILNWGEFPAGPEGLICLENAREVTIRNCRLRNSGTDGILMRHANRGHLVADCLIEDAGFNAIQITGYPIGQGPFTDEKAAYVSRNVRITNNYLRDCGRRVGHGGGVWIYQSGGHEIDHNLIENMPRYGIDLLGQSYEYMMLPETSGGNGGKLYGKPVTWDNHLDWLYTREINMHHNEIRDVMKNSQDGGAITSWGVGAGNVIDNNLIHHIQAFHPRASIVGIYPDDASKRFRITNNIVAHLSGAGDVYPMLIKGMDNVVTNNVIADNDMEAAFMSVSAGIAGLPDSIPGAKDEKVEQNTFTRNIVSRNRGQVIYKCWPWSERMYKECDHNVFHHERAVSEVKIDWNPKPWSDWRSHCGGRLDAHSIADDPRFVDPENMDYRLRDDSPAKSLGIESIDTTEIGPSVAHPFIDQIRKADAAFRPMPRRLARNR